MVYVDEQDTNVAVELPAANAIEPVRAAVVPGIARNSTLSQLAVSISMTGELLLYAMLAMSKFRDGCMVIPP
jgi:hypothetical protein